MLINLWLLLLSFLIGFIHSASFDENTLENSKELAEPHQEGALLEKGESISEVSSTQVLYAEYVISRVARMINDPSIGLSDTESVDEAIDKAIAREEPHAFEFLLNFDSILFSKMTRRKILEKLISLNRAEIVIVFLNRPGFQSEDDQYYALELASGSDETFKLFEKLLERIPLNNHKIRELFVHTAAKNSPRAFLHLALAYPEKVKKYDFKKAYRNAKRNFSFEIIDLFINYAETFGLKSKWRKKAKRFYKKYYK